MKKKRGRPRKKQGRGRPKKKQTEQHLVNSLVLHTGSKSAGNDNLDNDIKNIINRIHKNKMMTANQKKQLLITHTLLAASHLAVCFHVFSCAWPFLGSMISHCAPSAQELRVAEKDSAVCKLRYSVFLSCCFDTVRLCVKHIECCASH